MNTITTRPNESFRPIQIASTVRATSVEAIDPVPNLVSQIIKSGSPKPHATISNAMVARVDSYTPPPGHNMAHYLALDVRKAGNGMTGVADAMQRYLDVSPTRKPGGDPKNMASLDSYPTLVIDEDQQWGPPHPYQFSVNGIVQNQVQPTFYTQGGSLGVRVVGTGVATIKTPETQANEPLPAGPQPAGAYYPFPVAAQLAMRRLTDLFDDSGRLPIAGVGPDLTRSPNETIPSVAATLAPLRERVGPKISESVKTGLIQFANLGIYSKPPMLHLTAVALMT